MIAASVVSDDGLVISNGGATVLLRDQSRRASNSVFLRIDTDSCGVLQRMEDRRSMLMEGALSEGFDDDMDSGELRPSDEAWALVGELLLAHPEVAVMSDAIDKSCEYYSPLDDDGRDTSDIA